MENTNLSQINPRKSWRNANLSIYVVIFILLICSRAFDIYTTYIATPDLARELNLVVRIFRLGWINLIFMNIAIVVVFSLLFMSSWSNRMKSYPAKRKGGFMPFKKYVFNGGEIDSNKAAPSTPGQRNIALELGVTLPVYIVITGFFQGAMNLLVHSGYVIITHTYFVYLYPIAIGGIFGYLSLSLSKRFLYSNHIKGNREPHKVLMAKTS